MNSDWRYLGPSNWSQKVLRLLPFSKLFNEAAKKHDIGYGIGGNKSNKNYIDSTFIWDMITVCNWNPFSWLFACFYYLAVRLFGFMFFNYKKKDL